MEHPHKHHQKNHSHGMNHGSAQDFLRRFWIVTILLVPLLLTSDFVLSRTSLELGAAARWVQFGLATTIFAFALVFFKHAWHEIKGRAYGMMTLVSLAVAAGFSYSVAATFIPALNVEFYLEISTLIWVLLFGHYLEARSSTAAGSALQEVAKLLPQKAHVLTNGAQQEIPISELKADMIVLVKPGEKVPADGVIIEGTANVDEALVSGESKPVQKKSGDAAIAGSICLDGSLQVKLTRVGEHSTVGQIKQLIIEAQKTKPRSQRIADKAAAILTFIAAGTAVLTIIVWAGFLGEPFVFAITLGITVLVIACPHALGLAIPTVTTIATQLATKNGLFIKDLSKLEAIRNVDVVVFDKTGTLTTGVFGVVAVATESMSQNELLSIAASLEGHSSHVIGQSIVDYANQFGATQQEVADFQNVSGKGVRGSIASVHYSLGNEALMHGLEVPQRLKEEIKKLEEKAATFVYLANDTEVIGVLALADEVKEQAAAVVKEMRDMGIAVAMLTGDNENVAQAVAHELGIETYFANVLPEEKYLKIKKLQENGASVLMVGDGINDAPALTQADVGVAIGTGTDVAVEAGDVLLTQDDPGDVRRLIQLSKRVYRKMIQNLVWALGYNVVALPAAAGAFSAWGFFLRPEVGAFIMSLSTVIVVANALTLKRVTFD